MISRSGGGEPPEGRSARNPLAARYPDLSNKRIVITGGASGIGLCLLEAFADQDAAVVAIDRDAEALARCREQFAGRTVSFVQADLGSAAGVERAMAEAGADGAMDVLIANAGDDTRHPWDAVTPEGWRAAIGINLDHQFFCAQAAARAMVAAGRPGCLIMLGSVAARRGRPAMAGYLSAKAAIEGLVRGLAHELGHNGIRVVGLLPGAIETERQRRLWRTPESVRYVLSEQASPVLLDGWDVAALALFLASGDARGCTGHMYAVDAGFA